MTTSIDTNLLVALWNEDDTLNKAAAKALGSIREDLVICGVVYAELLAERGRTEEFLDNFFFETRIEVEWDLDQSIWRSAGNAFAGYSTRRRKSRSGTPRRILADFLIGAHAGVKGYTLVTLDDRLYRAAFPKLRLIRA